MAVRPLNGLVSIAECTSRFEADTAVARLAAAGIDAAVVGDPAHAVAPHLVTDRAFSVLVRIAIADDAQQALVRPPSADPEPSHLVHPSLRPRPGQPPLAPAGPPTPEDQRFDDDLDDLDGDVDDGGERARPGRPRWVKAVAWTTVASVVLPLVAGALRTLSEL